MLQPVAFDLESVSAQTLLQLSSCDQIILTLVCSFFAALSTAVLQIIAAAFAPSAAATVFGAVPLVGLSPAGLLGVVFHQELLVAECHVQRGCADNSMGLCQVVGDQEAVLVGGYDGEGQHLYLGDRVGAVEKGHVDAEVARSTEDPFFFGLS